VLGAAAVARLTRRNEKRKRKKKKKKKKRKKKKKGKKKFRRLCATAPSLRAQDDALRGEAGGEKEKECPLDVQI